MRNQPTYANVVASTPVPASTRKSAPWGMLAAIDLQAGQRRRRSEDVGESERDLSLRSAAAVEQPAAASRIRCAEGFIRAPFVVGMT